MENREKVSSDASHRDLTNLARPSFTPAIAVIILSLVLIPFLGSAQADVPAGFSDTLVAQGLNFPTAMEVAPDGRIFVSEQCGGLRVIKDGVLLAQPFTTIPVDCSGERGLMGIAFDPNFISNGYLYVFYTTQNDPTIHSRVSKMVADPANPDVVLAGSEIAILDLEPLQTESHIGGAIEFGPDDKLYVATGENYFTYLSQTLSSRLGKILRINSDGTIPTDNPFYNVTGAYQEIWALGLRNPFTFQFSSTGTMHIADVGQTAWEEINVGLAGANYGWPTCEGDCNDPQFVDPVYAYSHPGGGCPTCGGASISGGPFYNASQFPVEYLDSYFFADYVQGFIKRLTPTNQEVDFASNLSFPVGLEVAPDGSLYYLTIFPGEVRKIQFDASNNYPTAVVTANPSSGPPPLSVTFDGSGSSDLDLDPLTYSWDFGDGSPTGSGVSVQHNYTIAGAYTVSLTVNDGNGGVDNDFVSITVGNPPIGTINAPINGTFYDAGDTILFSGSATDIEDGTLPASAYVWTVAFHHNTHTHPFNQYTNVTSGSFVIPTIGETSDNVWYRIYLQVTDSDGLTHTSFTEVFPNKSTITVDTNVVGLNILVDGQPNTAPHTFVGVVGISRTLEAPNSQTLNASNYNYNSWSDAGERLHTILTPATSTTYTATYDLDTSGNPLTHILTVDSVNMTGSPALGLYVTILDNNGTLVDFGWTTHTFNATEGITYTVTPQDFGDLIFDHWENTSVQRERTISLTSDTTVTAYYRSSSIPPPTTFNLSINSEDLIGNSIVGHATSIDFEGTILQTGFTPMTFLGQPNQIYTATIEDSGGYIFDHWEDNSTDNARAIILNTDLILTAFFNDTNIDTTPPVVSANPTGGTFIESVLVTLTATDNVDPNPSIYYTTDGSPATNSSTLYIAPLTITVDTTLNFIATDVLGNISPNSAEAYIVNLSTDPKLTITSVDMAGNPSLGFFTTIHEGATLVDSGPTTIIYTANPNATYTVESQDFLPLVFDHWEDNSTVRIRNVTLNSDITITASFRDSTLDVTAPVVSANPTGGTYIDSVIVSLNATDDFDPNPLIYFTTDGTPATINNTLYTVPLNIINDTTVNFMAVDISNNTSPNSAEVYDINLAAPELTVTSVDMAGNPSLGFFTTILDGATLVDSGFTTLIHIGTNGTTYTVETQDALPLVFDHWEDNSTVRIRNVTLNSDITITASYRDATLDVTAPVVSANPTGGTFIDSVNVTLSAIDDFDPNPLIYFTTDGTPATINNTLYTVPLNIINDTTVNFMAVDISGNESPSSAEVYDITTSDPELTVTSVDMAGNPSLGFYTVILDGATVVDTGFTPMTFVGTVNTTYTIETQDFGPLVFDHWENNSTVRLRDVTLNSDITVTSFYTDNTVDVTAPVVSANPTGGLFSNSVNVTLSATDDVDPSPIIYYTTDGSPATNSSTVYTVPLNIISNTTVNFIATDVSGNISPNSAEVYNITLATTVELTIVTVDSVGAEIPDLFVAIFDEGVIVDSGFSPVTFNVNIGESYEVGTGNFGSTVFDHWEDNSTAQPRAFSITTDTTYTASYTP